MSCEKYRELISADLDGELNKEEREVLEKHLSDCAECRRLAEELKKMRVMAVSSEFENMPIELENKILTKTVHVQKKKSIVDIFKGYYRIPRGLVWAGVLALLLLAGDAFLKSLKPESVTPVVRIERLDSQGKVQKVVLTENDIVSVKTVTKRNDRL